MNDKIIRFPGFDATEGAGEESAPVRWDELDADQLKAVQIVLSGMDFVCLGIKPTGGGADFYTAVHGDQRVLNEAQPHLSGVIDRALARRAER